MEDITNRGNWGMYGVCGNSLYNNSINLKKFYSKNSVRKRIQEMSRCDVTVIALCISSGKSENIQWA